MIVYYYACISYIRIYWYMAAYIFFIYLSRPKLHSLIIIKASFIIAITCTDNVIFSPLLLLKIDIEYV